MKADQAPVRTLTHREIDIRVYTYIGGKSIKYTFAKDEPHVYYKAIAYTCDGDILCTHSCPLILVSINQLKRKINKIYYQDVTNPIFKKKKDAN